MEPVRRISYTELATLPESDTLGQMAKGARDLMCGATEQPFPNGLFNDNPLGRWASEGFRSMVGCNPAPPPASGQYYTPEGRCPGILYNITVPGGYEERLMSGAWEPRTYVAGNTNRLGPVTNIRFQKEGNFRAWYCDVGVPGTANYVQNLRVAAVADNVTNSIRGAFSQFRIRRVDNAPDECANPVTPVYPDPPSRTDPVPPPQFQLPKIIVIPIAVGVYAPVSISANIDINGQANFRIANSFDFNFNAGGINIYFNPEVNIDLFPHAPSPGHPLPPGYPKPPTGNGGGSGDGEGAGCDLTQVIELLEDIRDCACGDRRPFVIEVDTFTKRNNDTLTLPDTVLAVTLEITKEPVTPKKEWGGGNAPDVYYAGWASFSKFDGQCERTPIDFARKCYIPDEKQRIFSFTMRRDYECTARVYRKRYLT